MAAIVLAIFLLGRASSRPLIQPNRHIQGQTGTETPAGKSASSIAAGMSILQMPLSSRLIDTVLATLSVIIVMLVYAVLIKRSTLMSTTALYPRRPLELNIGQILSLCWPDRSADVLVSVKRQSDSVPARDDKDCLSHLKLLHLGRTPLDNKDGRVAKGLQETEISASRIDLKPPLWLTSGSPLTKSIVQLLVWEWSTIWLLAFMLFATLIHNGFFTGQTTIDSYARLSVVVIYLFAYLGHSTYIWTGACVFFQYVAIGSSWSLLERANFGICQLGQLPRHQSGEPFKFRSIDKASQEHVPKTLSAFIRNEAAEDMTINGTAGSDRIPRAVTTISEESFNTERAAIATIKATQENERIVARAAAEKAKNAVVSNAMIAMGITVSLGFSAWTSSQTNEQTPNNFQSSQVGSLALLASLSFGVAAMFISAMEISVMNSSFWTIVSLKETVINGHAVEHYQKRPARRTPVAFTHQKEDIRKGVVQLVPASARILDVIAIDRPSRFLQYCLFGPAYAMIPETRDHRRTSERVHFDMLIPVRNTEVLLTNQHLRSDQSETVEAVNVCVPKRPELFKSER